jgi:nitrogenase molybdenum-iron protein alpha chain
MCHRSINYVAEMMEKKFGIPWLKVNFIGAESTSKSLRKIGEYFDDAELKARIEKVIAEEMPAVEEVRNDVRSRCEGKTAMLFVGGSRAHHYQVLFKEMGMKIIAAGYEFGHRDDYEGRKVLPNIKVDADSRNIEQIDVTADNTRYRPRKSEEELAKLIADPELEMEDYVGLMPEMNDGELVIDDISEYETERLLEIYKPSIFCAGIKEKFAVQKAGIPCKQLHSYDYGGPYAGYEGAINFYREIDRMVNIKAWSLIPAPWQTSPPAIQAAAAD